MMQKIPDNR